HQQHHHHQVPHKSVGGSGGGAGGFGASSSSQSSTHPSKAKGSPLRSETPRLHSPLGDLGLDMAGYK
ncbi:hypothetical protein KR067_002181, partial [Drosophila pandora]